MPHGYDGCADGFGSGCCSAPHSECKGLRECVAEWRMELYCRRAGGGLLRLPHEPNALGLLPKRKAAKARRPHRVRLRQVANHADSF